MREPLEFLELYGYVFGLTDPAAELRFLWVQSYIPGLVDTRYKQIHDGVPVFGGALTVHQKNGAVTSTTGEFFPIPAELSVTPDITSTEAAAIALRNFPSTLPAQIDHQGLTIVNPHWYGGAQLGVHLVYYVVLTEGEPGWIPQQKMGFFIDAHDGDVIDRFDMLLLVSAGAAAATPGDVPDGECIPPRGTTPETPTPSVTPTSTSLPSATATASATATPSATATASPGGPPADGEDSGCNITAHSGSGLSAWLPFGPPVWLAAWRRRRNKSGRCGQQTRRRKSASPR